MKVKNHNRPLHDWKVPPPQPPRVIQDCVLTGEVVSVSEHSDEAARSFMS